MQLVPDVLQRRILPWERLAQGKVRDIYTVPDHEDLLAQVVEDRISVFDCVLGFPVPFKGVVLNTLNIVVKEMLESEGIVETDLVAYGASVDEFLDGEYSGNPDIQSRLTIVRRYNPVKIECVVRGYLWGSAVKDYDSDSGMLHGQFVGTGLKPGDKFEHPIFDPTTKAEHGEHDEPISAEEVEQQYPGLGAKSIEIFLFLSSWAEKNGFIFVDTKFEFAFVGGCYILLDEVATLDSSRYWAIEDYQRFASGATKDLTELSKEYARKEAIELGIKNLTDAGRFEEAQQVMFSRQQISSVSMIYRYMFWKLTDEKLGDFWRARGVNLESEGKILIISGSTSDDDQLKQAIEMLKKQGIDYLHIVCSCHRAPAQLLAICADTVPGVELSMIRAIVLAAGEAAHLPGMAKTFLTLFGWGDIPVLGVGLESQSPEEFRRRLGNFAAVRSIDCIPGQPVEIDDNGLAFFGSNGLRDACEFAIEREFLPKPMAQKDALIRFPDGEVTLSKQEGIALAAEAFMALAKAG